MACRHLTASRVCAQLIVVICAVPAALAGGILYLVISSPVPPYLTSWMDLVAFVLLLLVPLGVVAVWSSAYDHGCSKIEDEQDWHMDDSYTGAVLRPSILLPPLRADRCKTPIECV